MQATSEIAKAIVAKAIESQGLRCWDGSIDQHFVLSELAARAEARGYTDGRARFKDGQLEVYGASDHGDRFAVVYRPADSREVYGRIEWLIKTADDLKVIHEAFI